MIELVRGNLLETRPGDVGTARERLSALGWIGMPPATSASA